MSDDPKAISKHLEDIVQKKASDDSSEQLVYDKDTRTLKKKNKRDITSDDRRVFVKMTKMFFSFMKCHEVG